ncbi:hypothetical protein Q7C36_008508 [Tachysurus vachellii]|uniref:Uncharacterized protein n=1 Tax=Tachysurus vachellii TaxID=175792 RepID=A0AA88N1G6_TACVA|nr:hypothetical protein Q7C36_008508 [Tachysurus vachellii]
MKPVGRRRLHYNVVCSAVKQTVFYFYGESERDGPAPVPASSAPEPDEDQNIHQSPPIVHVAPLKETRAERRRRSGAVNTLSTAA